MDPLPADHTAGDHPTICCDDNLRRALSLLLQSGASALTVTDDGVPVGLLTLASIRASTRAQALR
jgi:osmoprotectant transport system ATP-binding protein